MTSITLDMGESDRLQMLNRDDIYRSYTPFQKQMILISGAMVAMLTPFCDTIYLPALQEVAISLNTTEILTAASVSAYLGAVGVGQLLWGPLSDYHGRNIVLFICLGIFEAFTIACIFAPDIVSLIILRTIEGFFVGCCITSVQAVISDVFAPDVRGAALSYFLGPMLIGPIIAPLVGGILAETYTWRADFVLLAIMTAPIVLFAFIFTPETHHWYVLRNRSAEIFQIKEAHRNSDFQEAQQKDAVTRSSTIDEIVAPAEDLSIADGEVKCQDILDKAEEGFSRESVKHHSAETSTQETRSDLYEDGYDLDPPVDNTMAQNPQERVSYEKLSHIATPRMMMPWTVAAFIIDPELSAYYAIEVTTFAVMLTTLTLLPLSLAQAPYNLAPGIIGLTFLPVGAAMLLGAIVGGSLSDWSAARYPHTPHGIMIATLFVSIMCPFGTVGFGFSLQNGQPLAAVLITQCIVGFGQSVIMPSTLSFLSTMRPDNAGATGSAMLFLSFLLAAVCIAVSVIISEEIGVGYFFLIIAAISSVATASALTICIRKTLC
jgi:multidrug resistance protein